MHSDNMRRRKMSLREWTRAIAWPFGESYEVSMWIRAASYLPHCCLFTSCTMLCAALYAVSGYAHEDIVHVLLESPSSILYFMTIIIMSVPYLVLID